MKANIYKPSEKKKFNCVDSDDHWPTSIKKTIKWFPFLTITEHTANKTKENNGLIPSLLKMFSMFDIRLSYGDKELDAVSIKCINFKRDTGLDSKTNFTWLYDEIFTKFVLNVILHHGGMSWIIISNQEMEYEIDDNDYQDWLNKSPWYNTSIY